MPTWKKVVVSGSGVSQLSNDANYLIAQQDGAILSGSFSGSFVGDGSNLSGIATNLVVSGSTGNDSLNLKTEALTFSGDGQGITTLVDGATNTVSLVTNGLVSSSAQIQDLGFASDAELNASSSTLQGNIDAVASRVTDLETFSSSLDATFATEAEVNAATASLSSSAEAARASLESDLTAALNTSSSTLQSNIDTKASITELNASSSTLQGNIDSAISTANSELNASSSTLQSNIDGVESSLITALNASSSTLQSNIDDVAADVAALGDTYATDAELNASSSTLQSNIDSAISTANSELNASSSTLQSNIDAVDTKADTAQAGVDGLNTYSASLKNAITVDGQNVTVAGNFVVQGTQTIVDSTTVQIGDNIIELNGSGATNAGLLVNDPSGPASGSLIWKGDQNAWYAGGEGSEVKVLLATGDNVVSGSQQIQDLGFASDVELNASSSTLQSNIDGVESSLISALNASSSTLQSNIDDVASSVAALGDTYATDVELNASSSTLQGNIDSAISTANSELNASSSTLQSNIDGVESSLTTALNTSSSVLQNNIDGVDSRVTDLENFSSSLDSTFASEAELNASSSTLQGNIDSAISTANSELNASSSTLQSNINGVQSNLDSVSSSLASRIDSNDVEIATLQSFSSSVDTAMDFSGTEVTFAGNVIINGTASIAQLNSVTGDAKIIGDAFIVLNNDSPTQRYAGISVYDSGSANTTASLQFDGQTNDWFYAYSNDGGTTTDHGAVLFGPEYSSKGTPTYPTNNTIQKGNGGHHLLDSNITDDGTTIGLGSDVSVTGDITVTGTVDGIDLQAFSSSADSRLDSLESFSSSLDSAFASEAELNASSSTLQGNIDSAISTANSELNASSSTLQGNIDNAIATANSELNASSSTLQSNIDGVDSRVSDLELFSSSLDSIYATEAEMNTTSASVKSYADDLVANLSQTVAVSGSNGNDSIDLKTEALSIVGDGAGITTTVAANTVTISANGLVSSSVEGDAQGQIKLNGTNVDINGLGTADSPTFQDLTINGNLITLGTVTNVNTTDLNIEDKFVLLNSGSSSGNSGLIVQNSATVGQGTALFFDDTANRWALDYSGADAIADTATADAYVAAVVTSDDPNYQKDGNIRVDSISGEAYIFVS